MTSLPLLDGRPAQRLRVRLTTNITTQSKAAIRVPLTVFVENARSLPLFAVGVRQRLTGWADGVALAVDRVAIVSRSWSKLGFIAASFEIFAVQ